MIWDITTAEFFSPSLMLRIYAGVLGFLVRFGELFSAFFVCASSRRDVHMHAITMND